MEAITKKRQLLKTRVVNEAEIPAQHKSKYYSSWIYGAIRVALTVPQLRRKEALARKFSLSENRLTDALQFLEEAGLIEKKGDLYFPTALSLHLGNESDLVTRHHTNWRLRALDSISESSLDDVHFSSVVSLSHSDVQKLKALLANFIQKSQELIRPSPEEVVYSLCADFFAL